MRFEVPQFIEIEDKIVGPFTWRQFIYLAGGVGFSIILYFVLPFIVFVFAALPVVTLAGFLAFHRINNRPFSFFLEAVVNYFTKSKLYLWRKDVEQTITTKREEPIPLELGSVPSKTNLTALAKKLELNTLER